MDHFTQRMLERARARQEKIDQKLVNSGQTPAKRKPLSENIDNVKNPVNEISNTLTPKKTSFAPSPRKSTSKVEHKNSPNKKKNYQHNSPKKLSNEFVITKKEFSKPNSQESNRRDSDVSVEINIMHRNDIQIEVQVEERDAPIEVLQIEDAKKPLAIMEDKKYEKGALRHNVKSRLDRLGNLYSDNPGLSSPIHRTEQNFNTATPPNEFTQEQTKQTARDQKKKFGRLAALANQINNWEDDLSHHGPLQDKQVTTIKPNNNAEKLEQSTLDVSIHSFNDINKVLHKNKTSKPVNSKTFTKPADKFVLEKNIVQQLEGEGYRRVSAGQSRLVYDFTATKPADRYRQEPNDAVATPSASAAPKMATMVVSAPPVNPPTVTKKPSIKKYRAPTPPSKYADEKSESEKDKENKEEPADEAIEDCKQTKVEVDDKPASEKGSPVVRRSAPKLNGNVDRSSVLSKAALFEAGSPKAKDPAEMSLRERKALFEKNKGSAIVPKAPFGMAPSTRSLLGDRADNKTNRPIVHSVVTKSPSKSTSSTRSNSKENIPEDNISQSSIAGGIKGKLAALFNKEQTISETTIANKFKQEREKEMEMLQNRFNYKPTLPPKPDSHRIHDFDDDHSDHEPSENAPLIGSTNSLSQMGKKPEIIANIPKLTGDNRSKSKPEVNDDVEVDHHIVGSQPVKRRSSQDSPVVLSVLEDVKRIKVNINKKDVHSNGAVLNQPTLYPHLSDIETDNSHTPDEYSECGGSRDNLNKSDNWAETSFSREVMNVVKKNNTSYKKAVAETDSDDSECANDSELDDMLDEALEDSEGPTPPKLNKKTHSGLSSTSFVYKNNQMVTPQKSQYKSPQKAEHRSPQKTQFKSPQKPQSVTKDKGSELVHTVSFYRRMQNSSTPNTPLRTVRHGSPTREPATPDDQTKNVTTVRARIKELQAEITKQQTIIAQASQALNLCASTVEFSGSTEQAEGERLLLLATHRRQACVHEAQRLQVEGAGPASNEGMATLNIASVTIPLRRDYVRQLHADGAVGHHAVCLLKCRDRVLATSMQLTQAGEAKLHFPDMIRMDGLAPDFKVTVEIYLLQASKENLPHDVKYHIFNKKTAKLLTPKSKSGILKTPQIQSPAGPLTVRSPQFQHHGYCIFALQHASRKSFTLSKVPVGSPVEGSITVEMQAGVRVPRPEDHCAFLTAFDDVSGLGAWHRRWFRLRTPYMQYWKYPDDVQRKMPIGQIDLSTVITDKIAKAPRDLCARPNTILLECSIPTDMIIPDSDSLVYFKKRDGTVIRRHLLAADTANDRDAWIESLNQAIQFVKYCNSTDDE